MSSRNVPNQAIAGYSQASLLSSMPEMYLTKSSHAYSLHIAKLGSDTTGFTSSKQDRQANLPVS